MTSNSSRLHRRAFIRNSAAGMGYLALAGCNILPRRRGLPNIVYIIADDMGYGDPRCFNPESKIPTPHMDRLAAEGMRFTDAHAGSAVCTPTRYGLLTGRYAWRTRLKSGVLWGYSPPLIEPGRMTVASLLRQNGYHTACIGKWHLGLGWRTTDGVTPSDASNESGENIDYAQPITGGPLASGFDTFFGIPASLDMVPYVYVENERVTAPPTEQIEGRSGLAFYRGGPAAPGFDHEQTLPVLTDRAVGFIDDHVATRPADPFFLYFPLPSPHTPVLPVPEYQDRSDAGSYGDFVAQTDGTIGAVLDALDRHGLGEDTLVIVTSDNGSTMTPMLEYEHLPSDGLRGRKSDVWDGGHRVPFLARWPGVVEPGTTSDATICLTDLLATCADLTGTTLPAGAGEDSWSMLPVLRGNESSRDAVVHHSIEGMFAIRRGRWKLIEGRGSGGWTTGGEDDEAPGQLYDMVADIDEGTNLYAERSDVVAELSALLDRYRTEGRSTPAGR